MAGSKSDFLENEILDHVLGNAAYTAPTTLYFALYTVAPTDAGGGTEVSGNNYARVAVTNNATNFPAASGGMKQNGTAITWNQASGSWGTVVAVGILDGSSNLLYWSTITSKTVDLNDTISIPINGLTVTES